MLGPYTANLDGTISYKGNKIFEPILDISQSEIPIREFEERVKQFSKHEMWGHISKINHTINISVNKYFDNIGAFYP